MKKNKKLIIGIGSLATIGAIIIPTAIVSCSYSASTNKTQDQTTSNSNNQTTSSTSSLMNLYYNPTLDGTINSSNQYTKTIFVNQTLPTFSVEGKVVASANVTSISYQWYAGTVNVQNGTNVGSSNSIIQNGATSSTFTPSSSKLNQDPVTLNYYCVVTAKFADGTQLTSVSNQFNINVLNTPTATFYSNTNNNTLTCYTQSTQQYSLNITSVLVNISKDVSISSQTTGLTYQWYSTTSSSAITSISDLPSDSIINNATSSFYVLSSSDTSTTYYYCVVSGSYDGASFSVLSPQYKVVFNTGNAPVYIYSSNSSNSSQTVNSLSVLEGENSYQTLNANISALNSSQYGSISYQWYTTNSNYKKDGTIQIDNTTYYLIPSGTNQSYQLTANDVQNIGTYNYFVVVKAINGTTSTTFNSSTFTLNVGSATFNKFKMTNYGANPPTILNKVGGFVYLVLQNQNNTLPTFAMNTNGFDVSSSLSEQDFNPTYSYNWYFVNNSDPKFSNPITTTTPTLSLSGDWISKYNLQAGSTYTLVGTVSAEINGSYASTYSSTITIGGTSIDLPTDQQAASTSYTISIASSDSGNISINNTTSTTSLSPYVATLNSSNEAEVTLSSQITFNDISGVTGAQSGSSSNIYGDMGTIYDTFSKQVLSQNNNSSSSIYNQLSFGTQTMSYKVTEQKNGLYSITFTATYQDTLNADSLPNTTYTSTISFSSGNQTITSSTGYVKIKYPTVEVATTNLNYLLTNQNYALQVMQDYFNNAYPSFSSSASSVANFSNNWISKVTNGVAFTALATENRTTWSSLTDYLSSSYKTLATWGISITTDYSSKNTWGSSVSVVDAGSTNSYNGTEVPFNTLLVSINLINYALIIGNYAASPYNSQYLLSNNSGAGGTDGTYVPYYGYLYLYLPFNPSSPTTISINNNTGVPTLTWSAISNGATNLGFAYTNTTQMFIKDTATKKNILNNNVNLQGMYFSYNSSMNSNIKNNPLTITASSSSILPTYDIATSTTA